MNKFEQLRDALMTVRPIESRKAITRFAELRGEVDAKPLEVKTAEQIREGVLRSFRGLYDFYLEQDPPAQAHSGLVESLQRKAKEIGIVLGPVDQLPSDVDDLLASPLVKPIIDAETRIDIEEHNKAIRKDELSILPEEVLALGTTLRALALIPEEFNVFEVSLRGYDYRSGNLKESNVNMNFNLLPIPESYPILATRRNEITPTTAIGSSFGLGVEIVQEGSDEPNVKAEFTDPNIPGMILWHNFSRTELGQLADEKRRIESMVEQANDSFKTTVTTRTIEPLVDQITAVAERISKRLRK